MYVEKHWGKWLLHEMFLHHMITAKMDCQKLSRGIHIFTLLSMVSQI